MKRWISNLVSVSALSSGWLVSGAGAQVPQLAVEGPVAAAAPELAILQAQSSQLGEPGTVATDESEPDDWMHRYAPERNLWEAGIFIGPLFISDNNSFRGATVINPGRAPTIKPVSSFEPGPEIGLRGGYYPLTFLGAELEGMVAIPEADTGEGTTVLAARAHVVAQIPYWSVVPFAVGGMGIWGVLNDVSGDDRDTAFHFGAGVKVNVTHNLAVRLDIRDSITNQRGDNSYPNNIEVLAGANLVLGRPKAVVATDTDQDAVFDDNDQCPLEAGTLPSGCPVRDSDSDGVIDPDDQCKLEAGVAPTGCPIHDADSDGVPDPDDQCISEKGEAPTGCPDTDHDGFLDRADHCPDVSGVAPNGCLADADGDGILGADDQCPDQPETVNGFEDTNGCPDELPAAVKEFMGVIAGIEFDSNQSVLRASSSLALEKAFGVLNEYPSLRVEITGHTDARGSRERNVELSRQRAEAVKQRLVEQGIDPGRIESKGEGPDVPIAPNDSAAGRQKNRRIEFRVLQ